MSRLQRRAILALAALVSCIALPAFADGDGDGDTRLTTIEVQAQRSIAERQQLPNQTESITADEVRTKINAVNVEDALKYMPSILARKRHLGDTQAPITTRTSGVGASARSLIYADGVLLSALIGNNNSNASPRWGMVSPEEIERIDVMYGPFAAAYPGNSVGAVVVITTRMPDRAEVSATAQTAFQDFSQYGTKDVYGSGRVAAVAGDRWGRLSAWISVNHLDSRAQPLTYVTATRPTSPSNVGTPVTGAFTDANRTGAPIVVLGAGALEHQVQDNAKLKLGYDLSDTIRATYALGLFQQRDNAHAETYLRDAAGNAVYGGTLNIAGYSYTVAPSSFSNQVYHLDERHWANSLSVGTHGLDAWSWDVVASSYQFAQSRQRTPTNLLPSASVTGPGTISDLDGTGWRTFDARAGWHDDAHDVTFGAHEDRFTFRNPRGTTSDWIGGDTTSLTAIARGKTKTDALWLQDAWSLTSALRLTVGARYEWWRAFDGSNFSSAPFLSVTQPSLSAKKLSPKASLAWTPNNDWTATASFGVANRFPTVTELYQTVTTGPNLTVPNPNLRPERAQSYEVSLERRFDKGRARISLFQEDLRDALLSQTAPLVPGSSSLFSFVQNIDKTRARGVELVASHDDVLIDGLELSGYATWLDSEILADAAFPAAVGKRAPQLPKLRASLVATYRPDTAWSITVAGRYAGRSFATIDNSDHYANTYQGFGGYFVVDTRVRYEWSKDLSAAIGIDNVGDRKYFLFHPFPQRTFSAEATIKF
ncbi:TonB-dependent receptor [Roseiterribacter gracilis]|uniref:TonB-dependent receptor n=1 Tax=Roseiterribacter gracilis TaxID=2812848 RepID=A0A8S8X7S4_9PROT|nr:TonB-dependent receptor [Rhodospirillales bacterium TMPK1]